MWQRHLKPRCGGHVTNTSIRTPAGSITSAPRCWHLPAVRVFRCQRSSRPHRGGCRGVDHCRTWQSARVVPALTCSSPCKCSINPACLCSTMRAHRFTRYDVAKNYLGHLTGSGYCLVPEVQDLLPTEEDPWCRPCESPTGWEVVSQGFPALGPCRRSYLNLCQLWYPQNRSDHLYWESCHGYPGQSWKCKRPFD